MELKIHIAFGFHVNLYHSYRGDSNDERGFAGDIKVIRKIIEVLNNHNRNGTLVKGTWDFENAYSLEKILPEHAPDIITGVKKRVKKYGDELIIMSYNNGLVSCMDEKEFKASIAWSISNHFKSGIKDIFGRYSPIVRPQEMMFSPSDIFLYNEIGIKAICLYYSGVPFDGFRTLIDFLPEENAFNPLWYEYKGEKSIIIPTISHSDLVDYGCLRSMVKRLHKKQSAGEIKNDILIFINMDADAMLWYGFKLPFYLKHFPNAGGLDGLIREVKDLDYIVFDTPGDYLKNHPPLHTISFNQDIADGTFDGYASWAEKPFNHQIWTNVEHARLISESALWLKGTVKNSIKSIDAEKLLEQSFYERICLLSTTHFGLSSPILNKEREIKAIQMSQKMLKDANSSFRKFQELWLNENPSYASLSIKNRIEHHPSSVIPVIIKGKEINGQIFSISIPLKKRVSLNISEIGLYDTHGNIIPCAFIDTARYNDGSIALLKVFALSDASNLQCINVIISDKCQSKNYDGNLYIDEERLSGEGIEVLLRGNLIDEFRAYGEKLGEKEFLKSYIKYAHMKEAKEYIFKVTSKELLKPQYQNRIAGFRFKGEVSLPGQIKSGSYVMDIFIVENISALMISMDIQYPYTPEKDIISNKVADLGQFCDTKWVEVAPLQILPNFSSSARVVKYNYKRDLGYYCIEDFEKADERNVEIDSFNHHITAGFVGIAYKNRGIVIAVDRNRLNSMAFCPMRTRMNEDGIRLSLNPFGTYFGKQRFHKTYTGGLAQKLVAAASPHHRSLAPAYNGTGSNFLIALFPFKGSHLDDTTLGIVRSFCDGSKYFTLPNNYSSSSTIECDQIDFETNEDCALVSYKHNPLHKEIPLTLKLKVILSIINSMFFNN